MRKFLSLFAVLVLCSVLAIGQTKTVTGRVTDQQGQAVPFASVRINGSKVGVSADGDGAFTIKAKPGDVLLISGTDGEGAFAASNSCITTMGANIWFATGGPAARVFHSADAGETWTVTDTPITHGSPSQCIFCIALCL